LLSDVAQQRARIEWPYDMVAMMLMFTSFIVGVFYCLDALHSERRDRSILFWKSLPVSGSHDGALEAKHPPRRPAAADVRDHRSHADADVALDGRAPVAERAASTTSAQLPLIPSWLVLLYGLHRHQALARALLRLAVARLRLGSARDVPLGCPADSGDRGPRGDGVPKPLLPGFREVPVVRRDVQAFAFNPNEKHPTVDFHQLTPGEYLTTPGLWLGLIFAAAVVVGVVHLRRSRGPL
jgi:ABC-2 type transport system permease protein